MATRSIELESIIDKNGLVRDQERFENTQGAAFGADLIYQEDNGFQLWLGSLEDALSFESLEQCNISGILNCALADCRLECACSRPSAAGRRRCHARGPSAMQGGEFKCSTSVDGCPRLDRDQIKAVASFDSDWYSLMLNSDVSYLGIAANDEAGYAMDDHFVETMEFLEKCRGEGRRVLVHCVMGINRSSTALIAFLCASLQMPLEDAVELTSRRRGYILSNSSFLEQLVKSFAELPERKQSILSAL
jgi:hypothetical protein